MCEYNIETGIFHWYSGPIGLIPSILSCGYYFSINEAMTISKKGLSIIEKIPQNRILTETDAPFNSKTNIRRALKNIQMTENLVNDNFKTLLARIR